MAARIPTLVKNDKWLVPYKEIITQRIQRVRQKEKQICRGRKLCDFALGHLYYGLHRTSEGWVFREWAPNATAIFLIGDFSDWKLNERYALHRLKNGNWEIQLENQMMQHGQRYKLLVKWDGGEGYRLPSYGKRMVQNDTTKVFDAQVWAPEEPYRWKNQHFRPQNTHPLVYEAHVGMSSEEEKISNFNDFRVDILPRIKKAGYNTIQLMAVQEHPYYGSFGYHVANFFAVSSRFGTPDELKALIDDAHEMGIAVIMDLVHSHSVKNTEEGLGLFDGTGYQYFHAGIRRLHPAWDSLCFNYDKPEVIHFLLSNCKFWLDEYQFDGFRFDGVTSMLYLDHGLGKNYTSYDMYYDGLQDEDAIAYLALANKLIHESKPEAITVAEEMSGMPGIAAPLEDGGYGFDYRLAMGVPDYWIKLIKELPDEKWNVSGMYYELTSRRADEKAISYAESHDQALVGDKTIFFRLVDKEAYFNMSKNISNIVIDRGLALHKMIRLITLSTSGSGYLNFMGNEFGHPEWIDFPREGNNWSFSYARRQWSLSSHDYLKYHWLLDFDHAMIHWASENHIFEQPYPYRWHTNEPDQILAFSRSGFLLVFSFNPVNSFTDYHIPVEQGKYQIIFSTDDTEFGGFGRLDKQYVFYSQQAVHENNRSKSYLSLYIPSRMGMVLKKLE